MRKLFLNRLVIFSIAAVMCLTALSVIPTASADPNVLYNPIEPVDKGVIPSGSLKGVLDICPALVDGADYLKHAQADVTEDNAGNGNPDSPDDPDDGGWDWRLTSPAFTHSTSASPTNIYGATAQGLYYAYLQTSDSTYKTSLDDAAGVMSTNPNVRSAADLIFLMLYDDLPSVAGTTYQDAARAKYDARITTYGSATLFAEYIRDVRALSHGYPNGIIAWDIGAWARAAAMLHDRYPGNGYDSDADDIAEVIWQDSFNSNPGYFDIYSDNGWDPTYATVDYWWYTLGITGLIDAFNFADVHTSDIPTLVTILMNCQYPSGAISGSYGANTGDEDWQSTAYTVLSLAMLDKNTYLTNIIDAGSWIASTQDISGGWVYGSGNHYPEIGGENTAALYFGSRVKNLDTGETFCTIQSAIDDSNTLDGHTISVSAGIFHENLAAWKDMEITKSLSIIGAGSGSTIVELSQGKMNGVEIRGTDLDVLIEGMTFTRRPANTYASNFNLRIAETSSTFNSLILRDVEVAYANGPNVNLGSNGIYDEVIIEDCNFHHAGSWGFYSQGLISDLTVTDSKFDDNGVVDPGHGIGFDLSSGAGSSNVFVSGGTFNQNTAKGINIVKTSSATFEDVEANYNGEHGVALWEWIGSSSDLVFNDSEFSHNSVDGFLFGTEGTSSIDNVEINRCDILDNTRTGVNFYHNYGGSISDIDIHYCNIVGNGGGVAVSGTTTFVDATCNWWGTSDGPGGVGPGSGDTVTDYVLYCPWLDASSPGGNCIGGASVHNIDKDLWYCCIQCAVDDADPCNTIEVYAGTYIVQ
jgi:hypothetical protein